MDSGKGSPKKSTNEESDFVEEVSILRFRVLGLGFNWAKKA